VYEHPEYKALLAGILAEPANDLRRLVTADWLEEHGEEARAELIRLQCDPQLAKPCSQTTYPIPDMPDIGISCLDYITSRDKPQERWCPPCKMRHRVMQIIEADDTETNRHVIRPFAGNGWTAYSVHQWERGFVVEWRGPLAAWCGGECGECGGRGQAVAQPERLRGTTLVVFSTCSKCHGTGHVPGIGPQLVREYPIERVTFTDQRVVLDGLIIPDPPRSPPMSEVRTIQNSLAKPHPKPLSNGPSRKPKKRDRRVISGPRGTIPAWSPGNAGKYPPTASISSTCAASHS